MPFEGERLSGLVPWHLADPEAELRIDEFDIGEGRRASLALRIAAEALDGMDARELAEAIRAAVPRGADATVAARAIYDAAAARHGVLEVEIGLREGSATIVLRSQKLRSQSGSSSRTKL